MNKKPDIPEYDYSQGGMEPDALHSCSGLNCKNQTPWIDKNQIVLCDDCFEEQYGKEEREKRFFDWYYTTPNGKDLLAGLAIKDEKKDDA